MIKRDPSVADRQPCIVCGEDHRFADCKVLQNTDFLRQHYIRFCQQIRREATARAEVFPGAESQIPTPSKPKAAGPGQKSSVKKPGGSNPGTVSAPQVKPAHVSFIDTNGYDSDDFDPHSDFQLGRI